MKTQNKKKKRERIMLPNGCYCSKPSVFPPDWKICDKSSLEFDWRIQYYFYDPNFPKPKTPKVVKGMNEYYTLFERRAVTETLLNDEIEALKSGYNPYLKKYTVEPEVKQLAEMNPELLIVESFRLAYIKLSKKRLTPEHLYQVKCAIDRIEKAIIQLQFDKITIYAFKRSQLKEVLDFINLPDNSFNKFKSYLSSLFKILIEYECCENNLTNDIQKRSITQSQREVMEVDLIDLILEKLRTDHYSFYRYSKIFFYSGGRSTELFSVQAKHVRLEKQEYDVLIKKGDQYVWETKIIIQNAIPFWTEIVQMCKSKEDYLFSHGLVPGPIHNNPKQITIRWRKHVKHSLVIYNGEVRFKAELDKLNITDYERITADFYSMKHTFLDLLDELQNDGDLHSIDVEMNVAQIMGSHRTPKITNKVYTTGKTKRENERMKKIRV